MYIKFLCNGKPAWGEGGMERFGQDFIVPQAGWILTNRELRFIVRQIECDIVYRDARTYSQWLTIHVERLLDRPEEPCPNP